MKLVSLLLLLSLSTFSFGHEFYFAFAEVEYNDITQKFECTVIATTHDLEKGMQSEGVAIKEINNPPNENQLQELEKYLQNYFVIESNGERCNFHLLGAELDLNGTISLFLESEPIAISTDIDFTFDLLMTVFPEQQNKLTFYHRSHNQTLAFLSSQRTRRLKLDATD